MYLVDRTGMYRANCTDSAIRAKLVPWHGLEGENQAVQEHVDRCSGYTLPIRKGSDGGLVFVLERLCPLPLSPARHSQVRGRGGTPLGLCCWIPMTKYVDVRSFRPPERPFRRFCPNSSVARGLLQRPRITSSGRLLRCMEVGHIRFIRSSTPYAHRPRLFSHS